MTASARITTIQIYDSRNQHSYDGDDDGADNGAVNAANVAVNVAEGREPVRCKSECKLRHICAKSCKNRR